MAALPAHAQTSIDDAVKSLRGSPVYVVDGIEGTTSDTANKLRDQLNGGDNILIVMLPDSSSDPAGVAKALDNATQHKYIIGVSVGDESAAVSTAMPQGVAADQMRRADSVSTSNVETMTTFIRNVHAWQVQHPSAVASMPVGEDGGFGSLLFVIIAACLALGSGASVLIRRRTNSRDPDKRIKFKSSPNEVADLLREIMSLKSSVSNHDLKMVIDRACHDTEQYFARSSDPKRISEDRSTFVNHLRSVRSVLRTYIEVQSSPARYYDDPTKLLRQGYEAIDGFADFVENSIRRGRRSELTEFKVDTDILSAQRFS